MAMLLVAGCAGTETSQDRAARAIEDMDVMAEAGLDEVMLGVADPAEAVSYFRDAVEGDPENLELQRKLAKALVRAERPREAVSVWERVTAHPDSTPQDGVSHADALIRINRWDEAAAALETVPPTHETHERYRLEAMIADSREDWDRADSFYQTAADLTTQPSGVLNNWGYSKLTRGEHAEAERLFTEALSYNRDMFTAKNNLVLARAAQRRYDLPVVPMTQTERARLLHTMALGAIRQNDVATGRGLLQEAVDTHPRHFEEAARALRALENNVTN